MNDNELKEREKIEPDNGTPEEIDTLSDLLTDLARARIEYDLENEYMKNLRSNFEPMNANKIKKLNTLKERVAALEMDVRAEALHQHSTDGFTGDKATVQIKQVKTISYDDEEAFYWALEHKMALSLDRKAFENIAKACPSTSSFISSFTSGTEPRAYIAKSLPAPIDRDGDE